MSTTVTLGGDRLGSGKKQKVTMHGYERSTHNMSYLWKSTMAAGTIVPFMHKLAQPGDTWDIDLNAMMNTHPTIGPLFGSFKLQLDLFLCPIRLYHGWLHNNKLKIGNDMSRVKLPIMTLKATSPDVTLTRDLDNSQINPSCLLSYLGLRGVGYNRTDQLATGRDFQALKVIAYWDVVKCYYANKQEEIGAVIHTTAPVINQDIDLIEVSYDEFATSLTIPTGSTAIVPLGQNVMPAQFKITYTGLPAQPEYVYITMQDGRAFTLAELTYGFIDDGAGTMIGNYNVQKWGDLIAVSWRYMNNTDMPLQAPVIETFPLENIDNLRERILAHTLNATAFTINGTVTPYTWLVDYSTDFPTTLGTQEGLALKTYQSDLFNNWLSTEWIDGTGGINEITAIDTSDGNFKIDALILGRKIYDMLNRIAVSGGSYNDWQEAVYDHDAIRKAENPMYMGGLSKELIFQEVISNSESSGDGSSAQPLGTLAGKGKLGDKHKGGSITIKVDEWSYILGMVSLTPRIEYSQGNTWDMHLKTVNDLHKPALDEIGFQELITEQMAWWSTVRQEDGTWLQKSAGKQPAWINYMTSISEVHGNFAIKDSEMFMVLNRRYEHDHIARITDLTTYIDPTKFNHIFADTSIDAQNFWIQIGVDAIARRKMSAKLMPNL